MKTIAILCQCLLLRLPVWSEMRRTIRRMRRIHSRNYLPDMARGRVTLGGCDYEVTAHETLVVFSAVWSRSRIVFRRTHGGEGPWCIALDRSEGAGGIYASDVAEAWDLVRLRETRKQESARSEAGMEAMA